MDKEKVDPEFEKLMIEYEQAAKSGATEKAEAIAVDLLSKASTAMEDSDDPWLNHMRLAGERLAALEWDDAIREYEQAIAATASLQGGESLASKTYGDISRVHALHDRLPEALDAASRGVEAAREYIASAVLSMALEVKIGCHLRPGQAVEALASAEEALSLLEGKPPHSPMRARLLVGRAGCLVKLGRIDEARADLTTAFNLLAPSANSPVSAGFRSGLARWYEVDGKIRDVDGDLAGAANARANALDHARAVDMMPQVAGVFTRNAVATALHRYSLALARTGDVDGARRASAESDAIRNGLRLPRLSG